MITETEVTEKWWLGRETAHLGARSDMGAALRAGQQGLSRPETMTGGRKCGDLRHCYWTRAGSEEERASHPRRLGAAQARTLWDVNPRVFTTPTFPQEAVRSPLLLPLPSFSAAALPLSFAAPL